MGGFYFTVYLGGGPGQRAAGRAGGAGGWKGWAGRCPRPVGKRTLGLIPAGTSPRGWGGVGLSGNEGPLAPGWMWESGPCLTFIQ